VEPTFIAPAVALGIAAVAAVTDVRRGHIPNWLTLPPLVIAPVVHGVLGGRWAALDSVAAIAVCGLAPYLLFRRGAAGGGDVKLLAAIGAIVGVGLGLEAQMLTFLAATAISVARLAWDGRLLRALSNSIFLALNPLLPLAWRRPIVPELMTMIRLGAFVFVGTLVALVLRHPASWM
jgi:prepilin peptidase CpaA